MEMTKFDVNDIKVRKRKYSNFSVVNITIVSQGIDDAPETMKLSLHCRDPKGNNKFPKIKVGKIETVE